MGSHNISNEEIRVFVLLCELGVPPFFNFKFKGFWFFYGDPAAGRASHASRATDEKKTPLFLKQKRLVPPTQRPKKRPGFARRAQQ